MKSPPRILNTSTEEVETGRLIPPVTLWFVGQCRAEAPEGVVWELQGVFDTEEQAVAVCRNDRYWVCPIPLNEGLPDESMELAGAYFPAERAWEAANPGAFRCSECGVWNFPDVTNCRKCERQFPKD